MLKKIRTVLAIACFSFASLLFLDFTGTLHHYLGWMVKIQFLPALLALNVVIVLAMVAVSLLFGRVYCSVICPLGVFQDIISWLSAKRTKNRFRYSPALSWLRYSSLAVFIIAFVAGVGSVVALLEPYGAYGRIASNLFAPVYQWGNNALAFFAQRMNSYLFYTLDVWLKSAITLGVAIATFLVIAVLSWRNGRSYCNTICPVGTVLGLVSKYSWLKPIIVTEQCNRCGLCARNCKASCIDSKNHLIDYSRCVTCMDCLEACKQKAIRYAPRPKAAEAPKVKETAPIVEERKEVEASNTTRRSFLSLAALFVTTSIVNAQKKKVDGGLAIIKNKKIPKRMALIYPAGSQSAKNFAQHCTACQLCVTACPNQVLRSSSSLTTLLQPEMSFERGYCRPECVKCTEVCPTGAIHRISTADKSATQIGHAVWIKQNCVVNTDKVSCGNCARHCPTGAIHMIPRDAKDPQSLKIPAVDTERCIGCGACENLCPSRPFSAIYVEGHERHRTV